MHAQAHMYCMYFQFATVQGGVEKEKRKRKRKQLKFALQFNRGVIYISHLVHFLQHSICLARLQSLLLRLLFMQAATRGAHRRQANGHRMPPDEGADADSDSATVSENTHRQTATATATLTPTPTD